MKCLHCACEIAPGHRFCGQCGSPAPSPCARCGVGNAADQRFCGGCGSPLTAGATPAPSAPAVPVAPPAPGPPAPPAPPAMTEGRRQVTILFTDLAGFTELSGRLDAEDLHGLVQAYFDRTETIVRNLGGTVERYVGDAVMAVFGARLAHDDDALRALRAALDIQAAMPELSTRFGLALSCRVGIASGDVVVMESRSGYAAEVTVVGQSVNLASRIQSFGAPGDVLVSAAVHAEVARHVVAQTLGVQQFKGVDAPIEVWKIESLLESRDTSKTRFVGRRSELEHMRARLARCARDDRAATLALLGEAGIGKSRLLGELAGMARAQGWQVQRGRFVDFGFRRGAEGLNAIACALIGLDPTNADAAARQQAAAAAVAADVVPADLLPMLHELVWAGQSDATRRQFDAMDAAQREQGLRRAAAALVGTATRRAPLLLMIEDVHWADARDIARLADLAARCGDAPLLIALTSRPQDGVLEPAWHAAGIHEALDTIDLQPLAAADMSALAAAFGDVGAATLEGCIERSGGNPLFLEQLLRHAGESGQATIPASIRSLVLARMDLLSAHDRGALQVASVLGQRFELQALRALLDEPDFSGTDLLHAHMLAADGDELHFAHALIHEAAYASLLKRSARELHLGAAAWYAMRDLHLHARHLDRAGSPKAPRAYLDSAVADTEQGRHERAREEIVRGLAIATEPADRIALGLQHGQLLHDIGQTRESIDAYRQALDSATVDAERARAWIGMAAGMRLSDDLDGALDALTRAEPLAQGLDAELARLHYLRGSLCFPRGDIDGCRREHGLALEHARHAGLTRAEADALSGLGDAAYASGHMHSAHAAFQACMALCSQHRFGRIEAANRFMVATVRIYVNEFDGALVDAIESAELARRVGHQRAEIVSRLTAGWILITLGRLDEARHEAETGLQVVQALGAARFRPFLLESVARIELASGRADAARSTAEEAVALMREGKLQRFIGPWVLATLALCSGDAGVREAALQEGAGLLANGCVGHNHFNFYAQAIDASADARDAAGIERWASALAHYMREEPNPWGNFHLARAAALAASLRADAAAPQALRQVRADAQAIGFQSALARLDAAIANEGTP